MIKYFKELEKPNDFKIYIMFHNSFKHSKLSLKFYLKYYKLLKEALKNIEVVSKNNKEITLPNAWYILPTFRDLDARLYNTGGLNGHKETNLKEPYEYALDGAFVNPDYFYFKVNKLDKDSEFLSNLTLKDFNQYIKNNLTIATGSIMAEGLLWNYFENLKKNVYNYEDALEKLKGMLLDDFLIRCVGFHKVISVEDKIISTSDINYQEDFYEYLSNGWTIDFVKPLAWSNAYNDFVEPENDMVKIMQFHDLK